MYQCADCDSYRIVVEAVVVQEEDGTYQIAVVCDKGHMCDDCGEKNIVWINDSIKKEA